MTPPDRSPGVSAPHTTPPHIPVLAFQSPLSDPVFHTIAPPCANRGDSFRRANLCRSIAPPCALQTLLSSKTTPIFTASLRLAEENVDKPVPQIPFHLTFPFLLNSTVPFWKTRTLLIASIHAVSRLFSTFPATATTTAEKNSFSTDVFPPVASFRASTTYRLHFCPCCCLSFYRCLCPYFCLCRCFCFSCCHSRRESAFAVPRDPRERPNSRGSSMPWFSAPWFSAQQRSFPPVHCVLRSVQSMQATSRFSPQLRMVYRGITQPMRRGEKLEHNTAAHRRTLCRRNSDGDHR